MGTKARRVIYIRPRISGAEIFFWGLTPGLAGGNVSPC